MSEPSATPIPSAKTDSTLEKRALTFEFKGDGFEYFKIWIVNVLLTIVTLGIYSAWAKVRNNRYFYSNLYLDDNNFSYLAEPLTILKGRIMAVGFLIALYIVYLAVPLVGIILFIGLSFAIPYFLIRSIAFSHRNSAYKNIQFRFEASYMEAFITTVLWPLAGLLSLGLLYPKVILKMNQFLVKNSSYGTTNFDFKATFKDYAILLLITLGAGIVIGGGLFALASAVPALTALTGLGLLLLYIGIFFYFTVQSNLLFYRSLTLKDHEFESSMTMAGLIKVVVINTLLTIVTFGLYMPAAKVRLAKYIASVTTMHAASSLDNFAAAEQENISAFGEELGQVLDFGV